jgi:thiazole synthase
MALLCHAANSINSYYQMAINWKLWLQSVVVNMEHTMSKDAILIAGKSYSSRLLVGTGKYKSPGEMQAAIEASGAEIVTIAIRRNNIGQSTGEPSLLDIISPSKYTLLPNTAGCYTAEEAVRTLHLARELLDGHSLVKLEVLGDPQSLYPNVVETLAAAKTLVADGFKVMAYTSDDPIVAQTLEGIGCVAIMPLASLIGSGMGILNPLNWQLIVDRVRVPVIVDAGVGTASDAAIAMELGCHGVLMNTAIAAAQNPVLMASAMEQAVKAGRMAFLAGRMPRRLYSASPSSPSDGLIS